MQWKGRIDTHTSSPRSLATKHGVLEQRRMAVVRRMTR